MKSLRTSISKHPTTGIYQLRYKALGDTKWKQKSLKTTDKTEAQRLRQDFIDNHVPDQDDQIAILRAQLARLEAANNQHIAQTTLHIDGVFDAFLESTDHEPISDATLPTYISFWQGEGTGLKPWMQKRGINNLADIDSEMAGDYIKFLASKKITKQTAGKYITFFRRMWDTIAPTIPNPWKTKKARGVGGTLSKRPFTVDHQRSIIQYIDTYFDTIPRKGTHIISDETKSVAKIEYKALHIILAYTGLRMVDACLLRIEEVDFNRGVIELAPLKTRHRSDNPIYAKIGIHPTLGITLRTLMMGRSSGYFLPYLAAEYDRDKSSISKRIQKQIHGATGLECNVKPPGRMKAVAVYGAHSHRKALEDRMREGGVHIMVAMQIMGHKDSNGMTQTYSHISDKEVIEAIKVSMPDLLFANSERQAAG